MHDKVKALEELVGALKRHIEAYKEQVESLKEFNDVSCKKTRKETAEKFAEMAKKEAHYSVCDTRCVSVSRIDNICKEIVEGKV